MCFTNFKSHCYNNLTDSVSQAQGGQHNGDMFVLVQNSQLNYQQINYGSNRVWAFCFVVENIPVAWKNLHINTEWCLRLLVEKVSYLPLKWVAVADMTLQLRVVKRMQSSIIWTIIQNFKIV